MECCYHIMMQMQTWSICAERYKDRFIYSNPVFFLFFSNMAIYCKCVLFPALITSSELFVFALFYASGFLGLCV